MQDDKIAMRARWRGIILTSVEVRRFLYLDSGMVTGEGQQHRNGGPHSMGKT